MIRVLKVYREPQTGVPFVSTTARIYGQAQIDVFFAMCEATARQPHELAGDIVVENLSRVPQLARSLVYGLVRETQGAGFVYLGGRRRALAWTRDLRHTLRLLPGPRL